MFFVGIDWSDATLEFEMLSADQRVVAEGGVPRSADGLAELFARLEAHAPPAEIAVSIEAAHGAWVQMLLDRGYRVVSVNPKTVEHFRRSASASGCKSDRVDRHIIALHLVTFHAQLKIMRPDAPEIVSLRLACEDRLRLVEERTAKINELWALLKANYPAYLALFGDLTARIALEFLRDFPTQAQCRALTPRRLTGWLTRHGYPRPDHVERLVTAQQAPAIPVADHLQQARAPRLIYLTRSLLTLNDEIAQRDRAITQAFNALPESAWIASLPGAGPTLGPALLACIGRDPERFDDVAEARALMGTAPVTYSSGSSRLVCFRRACWKFARRTLQLFARQSTRQCAWAAAFVQAYRARGHTYHQALRALAHKWLKIILAMKRTGRPYDERLFHTKVTADAFPAAAAARNLNIPVQAP